jgi:hypothetical protein
MTYRWARELMVIGLMAVVGGMVAQAASADDCNLAGICTAIPNPDDPELGAWKYCLEVAWDTGSDHTLSYIDVLLGLEACPCVCDEFPFAAQDPAGDSNGVEGRSICVVSYRAVWSCLGDPSLGIEVPLVRYNPIEQWDCVPGATGEGTFCFYSDWAPVAVTIPNELLVMRAGDDMCTGELTGVLPGCNCGPAPTSEVSWGQIKEQFIR